MINSVFQVKVVTSWKSIITYKGGEFSALELISSFRSSLEDHTSEGFLSLVVL